MKTYQFWILVGVLIASFFLFGALSWTNANVVAPAEGNGGAFSGFLMGVLVVGIAAVLGWLSVHNRI